MRESDIWTFIESELLQQHRVVLLLVIDHEGSTPGRKGFKMAVAADGRLFGSIGGGAVEYDLVEAVKVGLRSGGLQQNLQRLLHDPEAAAAATGMICGGSQTVLTFPCTREHLGTVQQIREALDRGRSGWLRISGNSLSWNHEDSAAPLYEEWLGNPDTVYIIGGGHVGQALTRVLALLGMRIVLIDDRPDLDLHAIKPLLHEVILSPFDRILPHIVPGEHSYAAIMTPSHRADEVALRQLLQIPLRYLGMMASRAKAAQVLASLRAEGVAETALQKVFTPIGLSIASHTPAEIAVSIAAEIIQVRNSLLTD